MKFNIDPTKEPILKSVVFLSIPMMLEMGAQNILNLVDIYFVSKISYYAIGALVTSSMVAVLFLSVSVGISTATGMYTATYWGAKKYKRAKFLYSNSLALTFAVALVFSAVVLFFLNDILTLIGLKDKTLLFARQYLSISAAGFLLNFVLSLNNATLRSLSLPSLSLRVMILTNLLNIILDPFFIFYLGFGIKGAAVSSIVSIFFGIMLQFRFLYSNNFYFMGFRFNIEIIKKIVKKGFFSTLHLFFRISSMLVLVKVIGILSQSAISAYGTVIRVYQILLFMVFGLANTAFVIVGQNFGAKFTDRVKKGAFLTITIALVFIGSLNFVIYFSRDFLLSLFIKNEQVKAIAKNVMLFYALSYPFVIVSTISSRISMALHDTKRPSMVNLFNLWFFQIPLAYFLSLKFSENGVWAAIAVSNATAFILNFSIMYLNIKRVQNEGKKS